MRIVVATQEDPFYLPPALDALCRARGRDVVGIIILPAFNEGLRDTAGRLWEFYGPVDFMRLGVRFAGAKLADRLNRIRPLTRPYFGRRGDEPIDIDLTDQESGDRIWSSRRHAVIYFIAGALEIEDLHSRNGTFVNRNRLTPGSRRALQVNDVVQIGTIQLRVTI